MQATPQLLPPTKSSPVDLCDRSPLLPDLGKYAETVLSAYAISIVLIVALVGLSLRRSKRIKDALAQAEVQRKDKT